MEGTLVFGWREWVTLPELGLTKIKAKVDTGARTSALHAFALRPFKDGDVQRIEFQIHPKQHNTDIVSTCVARVVAQREITDSGGHKEIRYVIETLAEIGPHSWPIEITLTARDDMKFRMLLGRTAVKGRALVDSSRSYLAAK